MRVIVYVEGPSDKASMQALLKPLIDQKLDEGLKIDFVDSPQGDKKESVITKVPIKAVNILRNEPDSIVVALPDLYPADKVFPHKTGSELFEGISQRFNAALSAKHADPHLQSRFRTFCFKHDLEALVLAAEESLGSHLGIKLKRTWKVPVEGQNHGTPPKRIVEQLFRECGRRYQGTVDAPVILGASDYKEIADRCKQCFKPFVEFLSGLAKPAQPSRPPK